VGVADPEARSGWAGGLIVEASGYPAAFAIMAGISVLLLVMLMPLRNSGRLRTA